MTFSVVDSISQSKIMNVHFSVERLAALRTSPLAYSLLSATLTQTPPIQRNTKMTRQLLLMRHAKSDWNVPGLGDKDRPLNARGKSTAPTMAIWLFEHGLLPDLILCSSAVRTQQTLALMIEQWESLRLTNPAISLPKMRIEDKLYLASDSDILSLARSVASDSLSGDPCSLMVLGHNPGMEILASNLGDTAVEMPTGAIAILASNAAANGWPKDWQDAKLWSLRGLVKPRELGRETI